MIKSKILVVGSFVMDLIVTTRRFPDKGETVLGGAYTTASGGKGANQAVQAARLGAQVTMVGKVGKDAFGDALLESAAASGVDISRVLRSETEPSAVGNVQIEVENGQSNNRIIVVSGANMAITPDDVAFLKEDVAKYDMVILQLEIPMEINCLVAQYARDKGVPVMLNSAPYAPIPEELLKNITYISPNEHEAALMTGRTLETDEDVRNALKAIQSMGVRNALITLGSRGVAYLSEDGELLIAPAAKNLPVKDPTAAGDSFVGAFCTAVCAGMSLEKALTFANYTAGVTCCRMGAQPSLPKVAEVFELLEQQHVDTAEMKRIMLKGSEPMDGMEAFVAIQRREAEKVLNNLKKEDFMPAAQLIWEAEENGNRVHITGIGKPSHVANYMASLLSSTGTPTYFLHGTEAVHGSCGQLRAGDVVICISNSGETAEMKATAMAIRNNGCRLIAVTGNADSWLAKFCEAHLLAHVDEEGGPLNRAPRASIIAETWVLQAMSIVLQEKRNITPQEYVLRHPGGSLGKLRENEK